MKQTLILLAGYPGTGKSYLAELLMKQFTGFEILSPDEIRRKMFGMPTVSAMNRKRKS